MGRPHFYVWECGLLNLNFLEIFDIIKYKIGKEDYYGTNTEDIKLDI